MYTTVDAAGAKPTPQPLAASTENAGLSELLVSLRDIFKTTIQNLKSIYYYYNIKSI